MPRNGGEFHSTSSTVDQVLDTSGKKYFSMIESKLSSISTEASILKLVKKYNHKGILLPGLFFKYVCEDNGKKADGILGIGLIALSVSIHDDLTDEQPSNNAVYVNSGNFLLTEGFNSFVVECHESSKFFEMFKTLTFYLAKVWECQQRDMLF